MGGRLLRSWLLSPLLDGQEIWKRQAGVAELFDSPATRTRLRSSLGAIRDLDRLATKLGSGRAGPRELLALAASIRALPALSDAAGELESDILNELTGEMDLLEDVEVRISEAIAADAPAALGDGGVIRGGFSRELDELREARDGARDFIASLQARERERTGIASLKVGLQQGLRVLPGGDPAESVPSTGGLRPQADAVQRRAVLHTGAEDLGREGLRRGGQDRQARTEPVHESARRTELRCPARPADQWADRRAGRPDRVLPRWRRGRPTCVPAWARVRADIAADIVAGRHPVVETMLPPNGFIPNDLRLDEERRIVILTGPNMAGKSTVLRQAGLIQIMAQIGSFVPADSAEVPICDRVFTRVGASDSLARGQSTFMVEMNETAAIVHGATDRSLVLLDEIGRGTSTYDGVSIAWAVTEHLHDHVGAKAVFATHYHELTQLADRLAAVRNLNVAVRETGDDIVFLRRLEDVGRDRSYGIQVARLAGFPPSLIERAMELLAELEGRHSGGNDALGGGRGAGQPAGGGQPQLPLFEVVHPAIERLRALDPDHLTPREALDVLYALRAAARER